MIIRYSVFTSASLISQNPVEKSVTTVVPKHLINYSELRKSWSSLAAASTRTDWGELIHSYKGVLRALAGHGKPSSCRTCGPGRLRSLHGPPAARATGDPVFKTRLCRPTSHGCVREPRGSQPTLFPQRGDPGLHRSRPVHVRKKGKFRRFEPPKCHLIM